jgi:nicotinic acid phosphoribosyltransferase
MRNLTLLTDLYELTMMNAYLETDKADTLAISTCFSARRSILSFRMRGT